MTRSERWKTGTHWLRGRRADAIAIASIVLFFVAFFPQALFGGKYLLSNDAFFYSYPLRTIAWNMIREGTAPFWTPHILSGYPLLSMAQIGLAYPLTWGYLFLPGRVAEQIYVLAPFLLAPIFTYAYLRELRRSFLASILGALTFGYGGMMASPLANNGLQPNAVMWLPLLLIAIERARREPLIRPLLLATFAYTISVLTGHAQGFVNIGILSFIYAVFLVVSGSLRQRLLSLSSWRPVFVIIVAGVLSMGVAAFQILETWQAIQYSVRSTISYQIFTQGSYSFSQLFESIVRPLFFGVDMFAFVPPLSLGLAVVSVVHYFKGKADRRVVFWFVIALVACVLMLGANTPLYRLVYQIPILNRFRVPSRHTFEWTFAIGVLSAYGWDTARRALRRIQKQSTRSNNFALRIAISLAIMAIVVGAIWWRQISGLRGVVDVPASAANAYIIWKLLFVLLTTAALWRSFLIAHKLWRFSLLLGVVLLLCYVEPSALISRWWGGINLPAKRFNVISDASRLLTTVPAAENRIYTRVDLFSEQYEIQPRLDPANLSALFGLHNVAGYEPLIFERYSRALGGTGLDTVHRFSTYAPDETLVQTNSHVLDLLNTRYLVAYSNLATSLEQTSFANTPLVFQPLGEIAPKERRTFGAPPVLADSLLLITSLSNSIGVEQGATVARVRVTRDDGSVVESDMRAGIDTAEWAHERPDVRRIIKHNLANVFDASPVAGTEGFNAYRFRTELPLGRRSRIRRIELENVSQAARFALYGGALVETQTQKAAPLTPDYPDKWTRVRDERETLVLRNELALPRAWLVAEAEAVDSEEALRRIRGESPVVFDPTRTALLEVPADQLPRLPGGPIGADSSARIVSYESNRLSIATNAPTATVLVLSEIFYPGWVALLDGKEVPIYSTNYLLRGVEVPAGSHTISMYYAAPQARRGLIFSALSLLLIIGLAWSYRRSLWQRKKISRSRRLFDSIRAVSRRMSSTSLWQKYSADILALSSIVLFFIAFFSWTLFTDKHVVLGDALYYNYPLRTIAWKMLRAGELPLWTPHLFSGYPLLSMAQVALAYPLTWGHLILPGYLAEEIYVLAPYLLAPTFTYLYLRTIKRSPLGSLLGALTFGYGGMMASPIANSGLIPNAIMWLPLMLIVLERARRYRFVPCLLAGTVVYSLSVLTGHAQSFLTVGLLSGAYAIWLVVFITRALDRGLTLERVRPLLVAAGSGLLSMGIAAFQILESSRVVALSVRSALTYQLFTQGSYKLEHLWKSFLTPVFYVIDMHAYVPPLAVGLAVVAFIAHFRARNVLRDTRVFFWTAVALLALVLMMGQHTRLYLLLYYVPLLNLFRVPSRHTTEWTFAAGVLAAYGWDVATPWFNRLRERIRKTDKTNIYVSVGLVVIALVIGSQWWIQGQTIQKDSPGWANAPTIYHVWKGTFVALLGGALWRAGLITSQRWRELLFGTVILLTCFVEPSMLVRRWWGYQAKPASRITTPSEITRFLQQFSPTENRVYSRVDLMSEQESEIPRFDAPNLSGLWGHHEVAGYEPLMLQRYSRALGGAWLDGVHTGDRGPADPTLVSDGSHVLDLLNTTFLISYPNLATSLPEAPTSTTQPSVFWNPVYENREAVVWRNSRAMPRAWLVTEAELVDSETALRRIRGETTEPFDPRRTALVEAEMPALPGGLPPSDSSATITTYEPNRLVIETNATSNTVLVVSEIFFPGWEVTVDGKPGRILVTDYLLRGVPLPAGQHRVEMRYAAPAARTGAIISVITLGLLGGLALYSRRFWFSLADTPALESTESAPNVIKVFSTLFTMIRDRIRSLPNWSREILILVCFLGLTALMTWPWVINLRDAISDTGDPYMIAWTLWWDYYQTFHDPLRLFHANIFYPFQYTLAFSEHDYGIAILFFPLFIAGFKPLTVHSIATFAGFAFCGYGAFRLTRTLTNSTAAGWVAGIIFAFVPFRLQLLSHLHYLFAGWLPLTLEALVLFIRQRSWKRAAWLGVTFTMNGLTCITWMLYALVPLVLSAALLIVRYQLHRDKKLWQRGLVALAGALLILAPFMWPYYQAGKLYKFSWPPSEAMKYSAGVADWFSAGSRNQLWSKFGEGLPDRTNNLFPGLLALLLSIAAVLLIPQRSVDGTFSTEGNDAPRNKESPLQSDSRRVRWIRTLDAMILTAFIIAVMGIGYHNADIRFFRGGTADRALSVLIIAIIVRCAFAYPGFLRRGTNQNLRESLRSPQRSDGYWIGIVWTIVGFLTATGTNFFMNRVLSDFLLPYRSLRIPSRAAMICYVGLAVLSGIGAMRLAALLAARRKPLKVWITFAVIVAALVYELNAVPLAIGHGAVDPDALTLALKETPMRGGLVELPTIAPDFPLHYAMLRAADHRRPLVNSASTFTSAYSRRIDDFTTGPTIATNGFLDFLEQVPTSYIAVRHRMIPPDRKKVFNDFLIEARNSGRLRLAGSYENGDELYAVTKVEPEAR